MEQPLWNPKTAFPGMGAGTAPTTSEPQPFPVDAPVSVNPTVTAQVTSSPTSVTPATVSESQPMPDWVGEEIDYDDVAQEVEVGQKASDYPIEKFKSVKNRTKRVAILTRKWKAVKSHYRKGMGYFYCFDGECCQDDEKGPAKFSYLIPVLEYFCDDKGQVFTLDKFSIKFMKVGRTGKENLEALDHGFKIDTIDLLVSTTNEQMQTNTYVPAGAPGSAVWRQNAEFAKRVAEEYGRLEKYILKAYARKLGNTPEEMRANYLKIKERIAAQNGGTPAATSNAFLSSQSTSALAAAAPGGTPGYNPAPVSNTGAPSPVSDNFDINQFMSK